jgi:hypothetical protein
MTCAWCGVALEVRYQRGPAPWRWCSERCRSRARRAAQREAAGAAEPRFVRRFEDDPTPVEEVLIEALTLLHAERFKLVVQEAAGRKQLRAELAGLEIEGP